jgi:hypothetical protein
MCGQAGIPVEHQIATTAYRGEERGGRQTVEQVPLCAVLKVNVSEAVDARKPSAERCLAGAGVCHR